MEKQKNNQQPEEFASGKASGEGDCYPNYLSFGGGVNSTALYFLLMDAGIRFEAIYVDHQCDWPETRAYVRDFAKRFPLTILTPKVEGKFESLYDYMWHYRMIPSRMLRFCTDKFKVRVVQEYVDTPCFMHLGVDAGEQHRARLSSKNGIENRYMLIEEDIDRDGCKKIIRDRGEIVPMKSGCWFCPFQRVGQWRKLRHEHPELFCNALKLEKRGSDYRAKRGKSKIYIANRPFAEIINDKQRALPGMESIEYPPCQCGL